MQQIECKEVSLWDGGDRHNFGFYISKNVPNADIEKTNPHCSIRTVLLKVFDTLAEQQSFKTMALRKQAWAKLTPAEREALGMLEEPK